MSGQIQRPGIGDDRVESLELFVNGEWRPSESGRTRDVTSPATGEVIATVPDGTREDAKAAIDAARDAQPALKEMTPFERAELCDEIADAIQAHREELARWLTADQGKPLHEARSEVDFCAKEFTLAAEEVKHQETDVLASEDGNKRIFTVREPHGVYGVITPWNYPLNIPAEYLAPGLAVGNTIVWVPAPSTSAVAAKLVEVLEGTDLPSGALNLVTGEGTVVGDEVVVNDGTDAIGFTGSPETGETISRKAGTKPTLLELGGNGPVIVLEDGDVESAVEATAFGCFTNAGQICSASERILVHESRREEFVDRLLEKANELALGNPFEDGTEMGPLNNEGVATKMDEHVKDALDRGATLRAGGERKADAPTDLYYEPTVLEDVTTDMLVNRAETFGPIAPIVEFETDAEALEIANSIDLGLTAGVFTDTIQRMNYFVENLETGLVNVNDASAYWELHTPFGGYANKRSGNGSRLGGKYTVESMSQIKQVVVDHANVRTTVDR